MTDEPTRIAIPISVVLLQHLLHLPDSVRISGVAYDYGRDMIDLLASTVDAPDGAVTMTPVYQREYGIPDPISIVGFQWWDRDGNVLAVEAPSD